MKTPRIFNAFLSVYSVLPIQSAQNTAPGSQQRVMIIGARPDDAEKAGGTAVKYAAFENSEYGSPLSETNVKISFPFFKH